MAGVSSTSAIFKAAVQASKGTPKTALLCGMMEQHGINVAFDAFDDTAEHGCRTGVTADRHREENPDSARGYLVRGSLRGALYPEPDRRVSARRRDSPNRPAAARIHALIPLAERDAPLADRAFDARRPVNAA